MQGYAVDTATLSGFRDTVLGPLVDDLSRLHQATSEAAVSPSAYPDTARSADVANQRRVNHDAALHDLNTFKNRVDGHIDKLAQTIRGYDNAEANATHAVASVPGSAVGQAQAGTPEPQPSVHFPAADAKATTTATTAATAHTGAPGPVSVEQVYTAYQNLVKTLAIVGLADLAHPIKNQLDATIRDPGPLHQTADRLDQIHHTANTLRTSFSTDLDRLRATWHRQASDQHLQWTTTNLQPHFDAVSAFTKEQAGKDRHNAAIQESQNAWAFFGIIIIEAVIFRSIVNLFAGYIAITPGIAIVIGVIAIVLFVWVLSHSLVDQGNEHDQSRV